MEEWYFGYLKNAFIPRYLLTLYRVHRVYHISFYSHFVQNKQSFITKKYSLYMSGLAKGIEKSRGMVKKAVSGVASDLMLQPQAAVQGMQGGRDSSGDPSVGELLGGLREMLSGLQEMAGGGTICIPVYVGGTLLDEVVVDAQARQNLRSGGR